MSKKVASELESFLPLEDDDIVSDKKDRKNRKRKKQSENKIYEIKEQVINELHKLQQVLGENQEPDEEELELQRRVFCSDSHAIDDLNEAPTRKEKRKKQKNIALSDDREEDDSDSPAEEVKKPAWVDEDDESILVKEKADTLHYCHKSVSSRGGEKYSHYVQEKFTKLVGTPKWADLKKKKETPDSEDDSEDELLQKTGNFLKPSTSLPQGLINIRRCGNLVDENSKNTVIRSVEFHPTSKVALVADANGTATLYQIDGKINAKIQSVHFKNFPIYTAHFTVDGTQIIVGSNEFGHFYVYDMVAGKIITVPWERAMGQMNVRRFQMTPDGKFMVIHGLYGNIHLVTAKTKELVHTLKMNGEVMAITFSKNGSTMYSHGGDGEIYVWDLSTRSCVHKFTDQGCITGTSLTLSPNQQYLATGSDSGVVNIYDASKLYESSKPEPIKALMNLTTEVSHLKFNCTSELLAMTSSLKPNALKLVHLPSITVFSNFPTQERNMKYLNCVDISLNSGYLALGNNVGTVLLHRLQHYQNY